MTFHGFSWLLGQPPTDFVLSDTMLVTPDGGEILTDAPREPIVIGN
jgi:Xaa-Pro dipeptidase